jgi:hypothetical protein
VLACPRRDLFRPRSGSPGAVRTAAVPLLQELLVVALQLVIENDAADACAALTETLLGAEVGALDLGIVRQFTRLPQARVERLAGLVITLWRLLSSRSRPLFVRTTMSRARQIELPAEGMAIIIISTAVPIATAARPAMSLVRTTPAARVVVARIETIEHETSRNRIGHLRRSLTRV